jgi:RNA polymerase sigma-70 factor, ECF subfamily
MEVRDVEAASVILAGFAVGGSEQPATGRAGAAEPDARDARLLAAARHGDVGAYGELIRLHDSRCRALATRLLDEPHCTDDALQDAYCRAFAGLRRFRGDAGFGTWLYRIVYNACMDLHRDRARLVLAPDEELDDLVSPLDDPTEVVERRHLLRAALLGLSAEQRAAVVLVDQLGLDYASAAAVLDVAAGTIGSRLSTARAALRVALRGPLEEEDQE